MVIFETVLVGLSSAMGFLMAYISLKSKIEELKKKIEEQDSIINGFILTKQSKTTKDDENEQKN